ncbi:hypothetical protein AB0H88_50350 [Nonomuraea sp. NPDC050680]|uniref:hypothetical protein n=1 Tax=Nonomuraea sp. NPDC050680 TaxID=3154630 RepID=UPI0033EE9920
MEPLWRTALALTEDPDRAQRLTAQALARRGDSRDAYFTLYRRFLSPLRRWRRPVVAGRRSRREWAAAVGLRHDGWSAENVADLLGWRVATVERLAADASASTVEEARQGLETGRIRELVESYRKRRFAAACAGVGGALTTLFIAAFLLSPETPPRTEYPPPSQPYVRPTLARDLPTGPGVAVRYAYRLVDRYNETGYQDSWAVVTVSGERRVLANLRGDFLKVSHDGLKIAHYDSEKSELTLLDVTSGWTKRLPLQAERFGGLRLDFSLDGRYVAFQADEDPIVVMDLRHPEKLVRHPDEMIMSWTSRGLMTMSDDRENGWLRRPDGSKERIDTYLADPVLVSSDGSMYAHAYDRQPKVDVGSLDGRGRDRTFTLKDDNVLGVERWVGSSAVIVSMQHGGYRLIDVRRGEVRPIEVEEAEYPEVVFGKL